MAKPTILKLTIEPYGLPVFVVANCSFDDYRKWVSKTFRMDYTADQNGHCGRFEMLEDKQTGRRWFVVWLKNFNWCIYDQAVAVHELFHLSVAAMKYAGVDDEEATAYTLDALMRKVWEGFTKLRPKKRKW